MASGEQFLAGVFEYSDSGHRLTQERYGNEEELMAYSPEMKMEAGSVLGRRTARDGGDGDPVHDGGVI
jgi:hypothetical protein